MNSKTHIKPGVYRHYKDKEYLVIGTAVHSETLETLVYYECLHENEISKTWVRPIEMFIENVEINGEIIPRFEWVRAK